MHRERRATISNCPKMHSICCPKGRFAQVEIVFPIIALCRCPVCSWEFFSNLTEMSAIQAADYWHNRVIILDDCRDPGLATALREEKGPPSLTRVPGGGSEVRCCKRGLLSIARFYYPSRDLEGLLLLLQDIHSAGIILLDLTPVPKVTLHGIRIPLAGGTNQVERKSAGIVLQLAVKDSPSFVPMKVSKQRGNFKVLFCPMTNFVSAICGRKE